MNDIHFEILEHLGIAFSLARQAYGNTENSVVWHTIEFDLERASWFNKYNKYDYGACEDAIEHGIKTMENLESEKLAQLNVVPRQIYNMIKYEAEQLKVKND